MTTYYVGGGGNDGNTGLSWAQRFLTANAAEDVPVVPGDVVKLAANQVYRELLTVDVSGANTYVVGTCDVTNGSKQVDGNGTAWVANVSADYMFHIAIYASAADGVGDGTATFTSAGGNFQAAMIGKVIQINTVGAYEIGGVAAANSMTLVDVNGLGWPGVGGGLTYSVMSGEGHYDIDSVDDNTTIQLKQPWNGPTLTTISYITFNPIRYIGDVTGQDTDGVGGVVRITGSDNDTTAIRANCIAGDNKHYRVFRGFSFDISSSNLANAVNDCEHWVIEDCSMSPHTGQHAISVSGNGISWTVRRCKIVGLYNTKAGVGFVDSGAVDDGGHLVETCLFVGGDGRGVQTERVGGITVRNCTMIGAAFAARVVTAVAVGQTLAIYNCIFYSLSVALRATLTGELIENYNTFYTNTTDRTNVAVGANSLAYPPLLDTSILFSGADQISGIKIPWRFGELSKWSQIAALTGTFEPYNDLYGVPHPVITGGVATSPKLSWGASQRADMEVETGTVQAGTYARVLHDAGSKLARRIPVTGVQITVTLYMRYETNYGGGNLPRMIIKQPGAADQITTMVAAVNTWEQLSDTFTPNALPGYVEVWVESRNTAVAGNYEVFYDTMDVT